MLPQYNAILVATDFTPHSELAFKHAALLARLHDAKIHLMHVIPQVDSSMRSYLSTLLGEGKLEELEKSNKDKAHEEIKAELDKFVKEELADHPDDLARFAGSHIIIDRPVDGIFKLAGELQADVIVIGVHHKGMLEHAIIGSSAERIIQQTDRPVLVVPLPAA